MKKGVSVFVLFSAGVLLGAVSATSLRAQDASPQRRQIQVTDADNAAADGATEVFQHALAARTDAGAAAKRSDRASFAAQLAARSNGFAHSSDDSRGEGEERDQLRFPGTLTNFFGGPTLPVAQSHPIFLASPDGTTCPANTCWGDPDAFLTDFGHSGLSHVTDQYVGQHADNRYTLGDEFTLPFTPSKTPLLDSNIRAIVHAAAVLSGEAGLSHEFHVFLPPGQDECRSSAHTSCYAPNGGGNFTFCAYHSAVNFSDVGIVLYSVEPFQNVDGCNVRPGTVNGQLTDSTNSTLSHEFIETITDPLGSAWFNVTSNDTFGEEIGDECQILVIIPSGNNFLIFSDPTEFRVGKHRYATQSEWSNEDHGCAIRP